MIQQEFVYGNPIGVNRLIVLLQSISVIELLWLSVWQPDIFGIQVGSILEILFSMKVRSLNSSTSIRFNANPYVVEQSCEGRISFPA